MTPKETLQNETIEHFLTVIDCYFHDLNDQPSHESWKEAVEYTERFLEEKLEKSYSKGYSDVLSLNQQQWEIYSKNRKFEWNNRSKKLSERWWNFWNYMGQQLRDSIENFWLSKRDSELKDLIKTVERMKIITNIPYSQGYNKGIDDITRKIKELL